MQKNIYWAERMGKGWYFRTEETSEYNKNNIDNFPDHKLVMEKWVAISAKRHLEFEKFTRAKKDHLLNLDNYINENISTNSSNITEQLKKLNDLYKSGALTEEEFKKAKSKILN